MSSKGVTIEIGLPGLLTSQPVPVAGISPGNSWLFGICPAGGTGWLWLMQEYLAGGLGIQLKWRNESGDI